MRGHEPLIAMRMQRRAPDAVYIDAGPVRPIAKDWHRLCPRFAHMAIEDSERLTRVDLRCVVGLLVNVTAYDRKRLEAISKACTEAGAARVIGALMTEKAGRVELVEVTDTEGVATWRI